MNEEKKDHQSDWSADKGSSESAGKDFDPSDASEKSAPAEPSVKRSVPIGRPVSDDEYRRLKERATKDQAPSGGHAQEDPSHRKRDG
jgi:hypothetical protein